MPRVRDFRNFRYDRHRIDRCGKNVGRQAYWKLYSIENLVRIFIHSVLTAQINPQWWDVAVDPGIQAATRRLRQQYAQIPGQTLPGNHDIYYAYLSDLNRIINANSNFFEPIVNDIDQWVIKLEDVRLPRNIVGHMNFPGGSEQQKIDRAYREFVSLLPRVEATGIAIIIP